jgi:hypothetical protein
MANPRQSIRRIRKDAASREDRAMTDRAITQRRQLTDGERVELLKRANFQSSLPNLPRIPGYHVCWVSTTHPSDTPQGREQLGYTYITRAEVPEFTYADQKSDDFPGVVTWREMVGMKLPLSTYQLFMEELHHNEPARSEESIFNEALQAGETAAQAAKRGGKMRAPTVEAGTEELGQARDAPNFCESDELES